MDEISSVSFSALCERYSRLAELYGWRGNVYLLSIELWRLLKTLSNLPVDPGFYEERVKEMMSKGGDEKHIVDFIREARNSAESLLRRPEIESMLGALRGQRFTSINELEKALSELTKEAKREKPRVFVDCLAEKGEGKVSILIENPAPLPMEAVITLEGAVPLKPAMRLRVYPRSTASWESRVLVHEQRVTARVTYKVAGVGAEGVVTVEAPVREVTGPPPSQIYLNKPIDSLTKLQERVKFIRLTVTYTINEWRILGHLGEGGFFHAFLAEREGLKAALKIPVKMCIVEGGNIRFQSATADMQKLVEEEATMLRKVKEIRDSEGLMHLIDYYESNIAEIQTARGALKIPYIALQYCPKGSLYDVAEQRLLSIREALIIALQVGTTLEKCYERRVFLKHGDIKPENLLVDSEGRVVLTDFQTALRERLTQQSMAFTPYYYHPAPDSRADVYALGRVLIDLVAGLNVADVRSVPDPIRDIIMEARSEEPPPMEDFLEKIEKILWRIH
jgi:hypothetical protein